VIITLFDAPVEVIGRVLPADRSVGIMSDYYEIDDLRIGGFSVYTLLEQVNLIPEIEERINSEL
jgi:hypothetical protein